MIAKCLKNKSLIVNAIFFFLISISAFLVRTFVYQREEARLAKIAGIEQPPSGKFIPFNVESAMAFNYAKQIASGKNILGPDIKLVGLEKLDVNRQFNVGNEYFLGYGYRLRNFLLGKKKIADSDKLYEDDPYFAKFARVQLRLWASLATGFIFLALRFFGLPLSFSLFGAILHCVSLAAIARYTGQDIIGGAFALPFLVAALPAALAFRRNPCPFKLALFFILSYISIAVWDMTQVLYSVLGILELIRILSGGGSGRKRRVLWLALAISVLLAALTVPYHREHLLIFSPLVVFILPCVLISQKFFQRKKLTFLRFAKIAGLILICFLISYFIGKHSSYSEKYSHFARLIAAKIRFYNVKPADPALLDFDARVLWTPAMHSANLAILKSYFPFALFLTPLIAIFAGSMAIFFSDRIKNIFRFRVGWLFFSFSFFIFYFIAFFFIVRYHVFLAIFTCLALPQLSYILCRRKSDETFSFKAIRFVIWVILLFAIFAESFATFTSVRKYEDYFWGEVSYLLRWFREEGVENKIFLADIEVSPMILAYCGGGIVLQPKFENRLIRNKFEDFVKNIFHGTERDFMKFCSANSVDYFVFDRGLAGPMNIYSMRYFANAPVLTPKSPVTLMNDPQKRKTLRYFYEIKVPEKYKMINNRFVIFKVITDDNSVDSARWVKEGRAFLKNGNFDMARRLAKAAIYSDPNNYSARLFYAELYGKAAEIRLRGF